MKFTAKKLLAFLLSMILLVALCACEGGSDEGESYYVSHKGAKICPGEAAGDLLDQLGAPKSEKENGNCGGQGVQMRYTYDSFYLYLLESTDGKVTVDAIEFRDDLIETAEGLGIGSSKDEVLKAYGDPTEEKGQTLTYKNGKQHLVINLKNDAVSALSLKHVTQ